MSNIFVTKEEVYSETVQVIGILEGIYEIFIESLKTKIENLDKINIETLTELILKESEKGNIKERKDIIKYIEQIIQD